MDMTLTTIAFVVLSALSIALHVRRTSRRAVSQAPKKPAGPTRCRRCSTVVAAGQETCPKCGVPLQVFEVVSAPIAQSIDPSGGAPLRAAVRGDMCVGCAGCVAACPEVGAITMQGRLARVDASLCVGHGECAAACPVGAISLSEGGGNRVEVPLVNSNFETNVAGLYIVGELGGRGLIKNAINEGKVAMEHVRNVTPRRVPSPSVYDVLIVGSGPAGLSAALEAHRTGLNYILVEQGSLSDSVRKYPRHKILFAEPLSIPLYGDLWVADASKEALLDAWEKVVASTRLRVRTGERVEQITRDGEVFRVKAGEATYAARRVVLAMGRRGTPRRLGIPGEELAKVFYDIAEMEDFRERRVLVVGGGDSAIESALGLCNQPGTTVTLSYRGEAFTRLKERNQRKIDAAVAAHRLAVLFQSEVREIRAEVVVLDVKGESRILPNDDVIIRIGGEAPSSFLQRLGVRLVTKEIPIAPSLAS
jgi:putative YpdA family bacillithiol system oxidoreductase